MTTGDRHPRVFLAHRRVDKEAAQALAAILRTDHGIDVWFDAWEILGGDNFVQKMEAGIDAADGGIVFVGQEGVPPSWTYEEYSALLVKEREHRGPGPAPFVSPVLSERGVPPRGT